MTDQILVGKVLFLDGQSAVGAPCSLWLEDARGGIVLNPRGQDVAFPYADLRTLPDQSGSDRMVLTVMGEDTLRILLLNAEQGALVASRARHLTRRKPIQRPGQIAAWAAAAVASVALIIFVLVPVMSDQLATFLPPEGEKALGDASLGQIRSALDQTGFGEIGSCEDAQGLAALKVMQDRLVEQTHLPIDLTVHVLDHDMINAFALPGGHIILFRGLIDEAGSADEVAAVFAHEMGHVEARDPTRIALRSAGSIGVLGLLFGDFAGGAVVLFLTERLIQADYTREAEANADTYAHRVLIGAGVSPSAIGTFFDRLRSKVGDGEEGTILQHWASHPEMGDRIAAARAATPVNFKATPILTKLEWQAFQNICRCIGHNSYGPGLF